MKDVSGYFTRARNSLGVPGRRICMHILGLKEQNTSQEWWVARWDVYGKMTKGILGKVGSAGY